MLRLSGKLENLMPDKQAQCGVIPITEKCCSSGLEAGLQTWEKEQSQGLSLGGDKG